jgi:hypothetical protein
MGLFGKETAGAPKVTSQDEPQHRDILPHGKPRGVATENGTTFEDAGIKASAYEPEEYDTEETYKQAERGRNRETYGSISSGSTSSEPKEQEIEPSTTAYSDDSGGGVMNKVVSTYCPCCMDSTLTLLQLPLEKGTQEAIAGLVILFLSCLEYIHSSFIWTQLFFVAALVCHSASARRQLHCLNFTR